VKFPSRAASSPAPPSARPPAQLRRWTAPSAPLPTLSSPPMALAPAQSRRRPRQTLAPPSRGRPPLAPSSCHRGPVPAQLSFPPCHFHRGSKARVQSAPRPRPSSPRATCSMKWQQGKISFFCCFLRWMKCFSRIVTCA
jgi:hypothetical protein